jgi:hypothetical protein
MRSSAAANTAFHHNLTTEYNQAKATFLRANTAFMEVRKSLKESNLSSGERATLARLLKALSAEKLLCREKMNKAREQAHSFM